MPLSTPICNDKPTWHHNDGLPMVKLLGEMNGGATWFFWQLMGVRNQTTNECHFTVKDLNRTEQNKLSRGFKELHGKNILKRVRKELYMINPNAVIPTKDNFLDQDTYDVARAAWSQLT